MTHGCPPPDVLFFAATQPADDPRAAEIRRHVDACAACRELLDADPGEITDQERARIGARVFAGRHVSRGRHLYAIAAGLVLAAAGTFAAWQVTRPRPVVPPAVAERPVPTAGATFALALVKPENDLPPEFLTLRDGTSDPYAVELSAALRPYDAGNYTAAADRFAEISRKYPARPHPYYYLGLSRLLSGKAGDAVGPLEQARAAAPPESSLQSQAAWYLAVALERSGHAAAAADRLETLCNGSSALRNQACSGVHALRAGRR